MSCTRIENSKYVNFQAGRCALMVIAQCIDDSGTDLYTGMEEGDKALFFTEFSAPAEGVSLPMGTMKSAMRVLNRGANTVGDINGATIGDEEVNEKSGSMTYREDFSYFTDDDNAVAQYKSVLENQFQAGLFDDGQGNLWKVIGTIGNKKEDGCVTAGGDWKYLFYRDNKLISPQDYDEDLDEPRLIKNFDLESLQRNTLTVAKEYITNYAGRENKSIRFTGCIFSNPTWNENGDFNTISVDYSMHCDARVGNGLFVNEVPNPKEANSLIVAGYIDQDNVVATGTGAKIVITSASISTIGAGAIFFNKELTGTASTALTAIDGALVGVVDTSGTENQLVGYVSLYNDGSDIKATKWGDGTTPADHILPMIKFDFETEKYIQITTAV